MDEEVAAMVEVVVVASAEVAEVEEENLVGTVAVSKDGVGMEVMLVAQVEGLMVVADMLRHEWARKIRQHLSAQHSAPV